MSKSKKRIFTPSLPLCYLCADSHEPVILSSTIYRTVDPNKIESNFDVETNTVSYNDEIHLDIIVNEPILSSGNGMYASSMHFQWQMIESFSPEEGSYFYGFVTTLDENWLNSYNSDKNPIRILPFYIADLADNVEEMVDTTDGSHVIISE